MSEATARKYIGYAIEVLNRENLTPKDKALIFASLAQAEATLELIDQAKNPRRIPGSEELTNALEHLANKLPSR